MLVTAYSFLSFFTKEVNQESLHLQLGHLRISDEWDVGRPFFVLPLVFLNLHCNSGSVAFFISKQKHHQQCKEGKHKRKGAHINKNIVFLCLRMGLQSLTCISSTFPITHSGSLFTLCSPVNSFIDAKSPAAPKMSECPLSLLLFQLHFIF